LVGAVQRLEFVRDAGVCDGESAMGPVLSVPRDKVCPGAPLGYQGLGCVREYAANTCSNKMGK
jgi:hypothetical protein